jgi:hypothetical protein
VPTNCVVTVHKRGPDAVCTISVDPPNQKQLTAENGGIYLYGFTVEVKAGQFEHALQKGGGFEQDQGKWYVLGRQGIRSAAREVRGRGWRGVRGTATTGCFREGGGYAGLCEVDAALIGGEKWSASMYARPQSSSELAKALGRVSVRLTGAQRVPLRGPALPRLVSPKRRMQRANLDEPAARSERVIRSADRNTDLIEPGVDGWTTLSE